MSNGRSNFATGVVWPAILISLLGYWGYRFAQPPYESKRPPSEPGGTIVSTPESRIEVESMAAWEDPLGNYYQERLKELSGDESQRAADSSTKSIETLFRGVLKNLLLPASTKPNTEDTSAERSWPPEDPLSTDARRRVCSENRSVQLPGASSRTKLANILLLPVMLPGGSRPDEAETRIRTRLALRAGLATTGFRSANTDTIAYLPPVLLKDNQQKTLIPFEVFQADIVERVHDTEDYPSFLYVLVLWLDESRLGDHPLRSLLILVDRIVNWHDPKQGRCEWAVCTLGPSTSDGLISMALDWKRGKVRQYLQRINRTLHSFSPRMRLLCHQSTVDAHRLWNAPSEHAYDDKISDVLKEFQDDSYDHGLEFIRTIGTDGELAALIKNELRMRRSWPDCKLVPTADEPTECIVLITESDSLYGRSFPYMLAGEFDDGMTTANISEDRKASRLLLEFKLEGEEARTFSFAVPMSPADTFDNGELRIGDQAARTIIGRRVPKIIEGPGRHWEIWDNEGNYFGKLQINTTKRTCMWRPKLPMYVFQYLKGLDGGIGSTVPASGTRIRNSEDIPDLAAGFEPTGKSQRDYLRRLTETLVAMDRRQRDVGGHGIRAIGVVGSDEFDKLMILRAISGGFPDAVRFTTDLDANYMRRSELKYTRNLVVACHYGLQLNSSLQREVPPFRDTYQTSTFLATLLAVGDRRLAQIVGDRAESASRIQLWANFSGASRNTAKSEPEPPLLLEPLCFEIASRGAYQLTIPGPLEEVPAKHMPLASQVTPTRPTGVSDLNAAIHPPSDRIHVTPKFFVRSAVGLLLGLLLVINFTRIRRPLRELVWQRNDQNRVWLFVSIVALAIAVGISFVFLWWSTVLHQRESEEPFVWSLGISVWPATFFRWGAFLISVASIVAICARWTAHRASLWKKAADPSEPAWSWLYLSPFRVGTRDGPNSSDVESLIVDYCMRGLVKCRLARALVLSSVIFLLVLVLMSLDQWPNAPVRGDSSAFWYYATLIVAVTSMLFLVSITIDVIALSHRFGQAMTETTRWRVSQNEGDGEVVKAADDALRTIELVGEDTRFAGSWVYAPFVVLLLMVLARLSIFDSYAMTPSLTVTFVLLFAMLALHVVFMRRVAAKTRQSALERLRAKITRLAQQDVAEGGANDTSKAERAYVESIITRIEGYREGAFRPWTEDPLISAIAIPFGGTSGLVILERFL